MASGEPITPIDGWSRVSQSDAKLKTGRTAGSRRARLAYRLLAWLFGGCILIQVFAAGMAIFVDPAYWAGHRIFGHTFELLPLIMLGLSFPARLSSRARWGTGALFGLLIAQIALVNIGAAAAALHPVNALLLFSLAMKLARMAGADGPVLGAGATESAARA